MKNRESLLAETELFVLDMDGTFYLGEKVLDGALDFIETVRKLGRRFLFFTNNSSKSPTLYMEKLEKMGCPIRREEIMTSGDVTAAYLNSRYPKARVYLVGTETLEADFAKKGITLIQEEPDVVVVSFDISLTYEKLEKACSFIRKGAVFLATHLDINCPTEDGMIPDCGAICAAVSLSTGVKPRFLGKPFPETMDMILQFTGAERARTAFVGDRLYTDIAAGVKNGAKGFLVLTGETSRSEAWNGEVKPDAVYESLGEMGKLLSG